MGSELDLGAGIVEISRKARLAGMDMAEWCERVEAFITLQPEVLGDVSISEMRPVDTAAGGSNGTLLFKATYQTKAGQAERQLVLRFMPDNGLFHHYDAAQQFELQRALHSGGLRVPAQLWLDGAGEHLTKPGYIMERVSGTSTPMGWIASGIMADASPEDRRKMSTNYIAALAEIHDLNWKVLGLDWLKNRAKGDKPIAREANWYWDALIWSANQKYIDELSPVRDWLIANEPDDVEVVLCHGDANFGNYLYEGTEISAVLDWEMAFLGTRECDLSFLATADTIIHDGVPWPEGMLTHAEMRDLYEEITGYSLQHMEYFKLFSQYRLAVINVLAMNHFPSDAPPQLLAILTRGPELCLQRAKEMGAVQ